ncbi:uncharacterized protein LOC133330281 [Musca vetustissima]|uniref:uncharacterized protein LOC133330281 n=1 Tax=Musca vetustissima TaxID=27455 RepID=UPI002AB79096|nr:uncharacterized protein LOC133330281 [Musca vetustissima]
MTETNETTARKLNFADLSKIPANEFEQHFHEWMERDDVARALQAKLRCDIIQNFNKTNLGKQIQAHTMSSTGGSTYRLTLSPLILALNTLVAEFLYAQNCHFTLSVFCTEVPFRNTLPDFESMRHYRFNEREINDIWEAVTGTMPIKRCLDAAVLDEYETDASTSLLLLIIKSLLNMKPPEMLHKTVEIQTDNDRVAPAHHCQQKQSVSVQTTNVPESPTKSTPKADNLRHINKYLLILSQKVNEMTREFEMLIKQRNLKNSQKSARSVRSRDFHTLNKSLERINENVKHLTKCRSKGKPLTNIVESIDNLTKQFGKCAESFGQVTRELAKKETQNINIKTDTCVQRNSIEKQTETEVQEKSYSEWINEMRTTENGRKFLERVEHSLSKAVAKQKEQWQNEQDNKMKQMKSLIKLHYKQKMLTLLSRQSSEEQQTNEAKKLNETIEIKLRNFETKQMELLEKLQESSFELQEAQRALQEQAQKKKEGIETRGKAVEDLDNGNSLKNNEPKYVNQVSQCLNNINNLKEVNITRPQEIQDDGLVTPRDQNVERIINEAKLRLKQLETESNCLEQHFQNYLERRRKEQQCRLEVTNQLIQQSQSKTSEILGKLQINPTSSAVDKRNLFGSQSKSLAIQEEDLDLDEEFLKLKEKLATTQVIVEMSPQETSPSIELKNAILDAKNKFFENEQLFRERKEREFMKESIAVFGLQDEEVVKTSNVWDSSVDLKSHLDVGKGVEREQIIVFNINTNPETNEERIMGNNQNPTRYGVNCEEESLKKKINCPPKNSPRRELFPHTETVEECGESKPRSNSLPSVNTNLRKTLKDLKTFTQSLEKNKDKSEGSSEDLLKQSMAKMKQLFEENSKSKTELKNILETSKNDNLGQTTYGSGRHNKTNTEDMPKDVNKITATENYDIGDYFDIAPQRTGIQNTLDLNLTTTTNTTTNITSMVTTSAVSLDSVDTNQNENLNTNTTTPQDTLNTQLLQMKTSGNNFVIPSPLHLSSDSDDDESLKTHSKGNQDSAAGISEISSDEEIIMPNGSTIPKLVLSPKLPENSLEIGEVVSDSQPVFIPLAQVSSSESSESSDPAFDMAVERKEAKTNLQVKSSDNSEADDFWA